VAGLPGAYVTGSAGQRLAGQRAHGCAPPQHAAGAVANNPDFACALTAASESILCPLTCRHIFSGYGKFCTAEAESVASPQTRRRFASADGRCHAAACERVYLVGSPQAIQILRASASALAAAARAAAAAADAAAASARVQAGNGGEGFDIDTVVSACRKDGRHAAGQAKAAAEAAERAAKAAAEVGGRCDDPRENPAPLLSAYSQIGVICLGVSGEVFQSSQYVLEALGLTGSERGTLLTHLHKITIQYLARILSTRRKMDHIQTDVEGKKKPPTESQGKKDMKASKRKNPSTPSPVGSNATKKQRRKAPKAPTGIG